MITAKNIQTEVDASFLYRILAENEKDDTISKVFLEMSEIEKSHAMEFMKIIGLEQLPGPSARARILNKIGKVFGYEFVLGMLMDTEKNLAKSIITSKEKNKIKITGSEHNHIKILQSLVNKGINVSGKHLSKFESRHRSVGGNALRAAVLGGNDGLVSNFSLVMGVAGATAGGSGVLLAGVSGLLAGALSMALGEWISVKSSQELSENQIQLEKDELETNPEGEMRELKLIYMAQGIPENQALQMAEAAIKDKDKAHEILVKEELGIDMEELEGSAMEAAIFSFVLFAVGAIIPVIPFIFAQGMNAIIFSAVLSTLGLFLIGSAITLFTGRSIWYSGTRQVVFGLIAATITFGIGHLIGVSLAG